MAMLNYQMVSKIVLEVWNIKRLDIKWFCWFFATGIQAHMKTPASCIDIGMGAKPWHPSEHLFLYSGMDVPQNRGAPKSSLFKVGKSLWS